MDPVRKEDEEAAESEDDEPGAADGDGAHGSSMTALQTSPLARRAPGSGSASRKEEAAEARDPVVATSFRGDLPAFNEVQRNAAPGARPLAVRKMMPTRRQSSLPDPEAASPAVRYEMVSVSESKIAEIARSARADMIEHTTAQLTRPFPDGWRQDSSNMDPTVSWASAPTWCA